jgi:hypothetical protein
MNNKYGRPSIKASTKKRAVLAKEELMQEELLLTFIPKASKGKLARGVATATTAAVTGFYVQNQPMQMSFANNIIYMFYFTGFFGASGIDEKSKVAIKLDDIVEIIHKPTKAISGDKFQIVTSENDFNGNIVGKAHKSVLIELVKRVNEFKNK